MDILPEITNRRSVRSYSDKDISDKQIELIVRAAELAPSGHNRQPWDLILVRSKEMKEKICETDHGQRWMMSAPVFFVFVGNVDYRGDGDMDRVIRDSAIAASYAQLQAEHMGLSSCWTGWYDQHDMRNVLGLGENCFVTGVVTVGYAAEIPAPTPRRKTEYEVI